MRGRAGLRGGFAAACACLAAGCAELADRAPAAVPEATDGAVAGAADARIAAAEAEYERALKALDEAVSRRYVGETMEPRFAAYVERVLQRVREATQSSVPADGVRKGAQAQLVIAIRADGTLESVDVARPSGDPGLDAALRDAVAKAAPFDAFPPEVRRDTSVLVLTRTLGVAPAADGPRSAPRPKPKPPKRKATKSKPAGRATK